MKNFYHCIYACRLAAETKRGMVRVAISEKCPWQQNGRGLEEAVLRLRGYGTRVLSSL